MIDRLPERRRVAALIREMDHKRSNVNSLPAVIDARAKVDAARNVLKIVESAFRTVFDANYPDEHEMVETLCDEFPDLALDAHQLPLLCAATGLPVFKGDRLIAVKKDENDPENATLRTAVLADAVVIEPGLGPPTVLLLKD